MTEPASLYLVIHVVFGWSGAKRAVLRWDYPPPGASLSEYCMNPDIGFPVAATCKQSPREAEVDNNATMKLR